MTRWEYAFVLASAAFCFQQFRTDGVLTPAGWLLFFIAAGFVALQGVTIGYRWHMAAGYFAIAGLAVLDFAGVDRTPGASFFFVGLAVSALLISGILATLFPVFSFPASTGGFPVGLLRANSAPRTDIFYPAAHNRQPRSRYLPVQSAKDADARHESRKEPTDSRRGALTTAAVLRGFLNSLGPRSAHLRLVRTHAKIDAPPAEQPSRFPVVFYCPSWCGKRHEATFLCQDLASHGFVVVCLDHPASTDLGGLSDQRPLTSRWIDFTTSQTAADSQRELERVLEAQIQNLRKLISYLAQINRIDSKTPFSGRLNLDGVGVVGFSFGGAVAAEVCRVDNRFCAGINLDGLLFGGAATDGVPKPFLFFSSSESVPDESAASIDSPEGRSARLVRNDYFNVMNSVEQYGGFHVVIHGTTHGSFCDSPLYFRRCRFWRAEPIKPQKAMSIVCAFTAGFFRHTLELGRHPAPGWFSSATNSYVDLREFPAPKAHVADTPIPTEGSALEV
jgi:dienelactone hydrolase